MAISTIELHLLKDFKDQKLTPHAWNKLLEQGSTDTVFLTWHWQKAWWDAFHRGQLLIIMAEKDGNPFAIAPLFEDGNMIFFVGSGGSDYLDFIGAPDDNTLEAMLLLAMERVPGFLGFRFYHIPESSPTKTRLANISNKNGWKYFDEGEMVAPMLAAGDFAENFKKAIAKKSLVRHESYFMRSGGLKTEHLCRSEDILPHLDVFFEQHIERWKATAYPSLFLEPAKRFFYQCLAGMTSETGWLRFTRIEWQDRAIAFHFGFNYKGSFFWYKPSFDISLARHSPGEVLLRQLLLQAMHEKAESFDFGLGDEPFKKRFTTNSITVRTIGVYPS